MAVKNKEGLIKALNQRSEFTYGGHIKGCIHKDGYYVFDYDTLILVETQRKFIARFGNGSYGTTIRRTIEFFNNKFYSNTTSKLQNILKEIFNISAPERKAYLFNTEPKEAYAGDLGYVNLSFTNEGLISLVSKKTEKGFQFFNINRLSPLVALNIKGVWCDIETKLLLKQEVSQ